MPRYFIFYIFFVFILQIVLSNHQQTWADAQTDDDSSLHTISCIAFGKNCILFKKHSTQSVAITKTTTRRKASWLDFDFGRPGSQQSFLHCRA